MASVVLGDPTKISSIHVTAKDRFIQLRDRHIDVLIWGDGLTVEREVFEVSL